MTSKYVKLTKKEIKYISSILPGRMGEDWIRSGGVTKEGQIVFISADGQSTKIGMVDVNLKNLKLEDWKKEVNPYFVFEKE